VLDASHPVRGSTAERVLRAAEAIGFHAAPLLKKRLRWDAPERTFAFLLQRDLVGLYICGGGKEGMIAGARDEPRSRGGSPSSATN
jgi:hypothetical protein